MRSCDNTKDTKPAAPLGQRTQRLSWRRACRQALVVSAAVLLTGIAQPARSQSQDAELYKEALAREAQLRRALDAEPAHGDTSLLTRMRTLVTAYEDLSKLFPTSGYSDNALWQGAMLSADAFWEFGELADRNTSLRLFKALASRFPASSLLRQVPPQVARLEAVRATPSTPAVAAPAKSAPTAEVRPIVVDVPKTGAPATTSLLKSIRREVLPDALRITLELERETSFAADRLDFPPRVFVDLQQTRAVEALKDATLAFDDDVVRRIRVGRQLNVRTRVVLDLQNPGRYSVYALYNPYRIVIDFERVSNVMPVPRSLDARTLKTASTIKNVDVAHAAALLPSSLLRANATLLPAVPARETIIASQRTDNSGGAQDKTIPAADHTALASIGEPPAAPRRPSANRSGGYSLSRQLGLGIARIVIDPGHGGHDPGAKGNGITEADLVLDVALRLETLLQKQAGVEVVLTRRDNTFVPLEDRTAVANHADADLFLSIHANASPSPIARGIETYFLNFAPNPEAEAIAARENAGSSRTMRHLSDIVQAIAMNNKIDESRDFATTVQATLYRELHKTNKDARNLGVKQAPFMVLIGATMPSVLSEISFITNRSEANLLKTDKYRQQLAEALLAGVMRYQQSLKHVQSIASQSAQ